MVELLMEETLWCSLQSMVQMQSRFNMVEFLLTCHIEALGGPGIVMSIIAIIDIAVVAAAGVPVEVAIVMGEIDTESQTGMQAEGAGGAEAEVLVEAHQEVAVQSGSEIEATVAALPGPPVPYEVVEMMIV